MKNKVKIFQMIIIVAMLLGACDTNNQKADEKNARIIRLYPTEKAINASANTRAEMDKTEDLIKQGMTEEEQMLLSDLLEKSISNILKQEGK